MYVVTPPNHTHIIYANIQMVLVAVVTNSLTKWWTSLSLSIINYPNSHYHHTNPTQHVLELCVALVFDQKC